MNEGVKLVGSPSGKDSLVNTGILKDQAAALNLFIDQIHASITALDMPSGGWLTDGIGASDVQQFLTNADEILSNLVDSINELLSGSNPLNIGLSDVLAKGNNAGQYNINMQNHSITDLATPTNPTDAATRQYVDSTAGGLSQHLADYGNPHKVTLGQATQTGNTAAREIDMDGNRITNVGTPIEDYDAARISDVQSFRKMFIVTTNGETEFDVQDKIKSGSEQVFVNGILAIPQLGGSPDFDYSIQQGSSTDKIQFKASLLQANDKIIVYYIRG